MLKSIHAMYGTLARVLHGLLDTIAPRRTDFAVVSMLNQDNISRLPAAEPVQDMPWVTPLFHYKNSTVKALVWELKYHGNTAPMEIIGSLLYQHILSAISDMLLFDHDARFILIPIPISAERRRERGYNQSEYIARAIMEHDLSHTLLYAPQWFQKTRETARQSRSGSREERTKNLVGCFKADPRVADTYAIVIDDVVTTGSTLSEARRTLLAAGARAVLAFTIAH